jgi:hypothetical protein
MVNDITGWWFQTCTLLSISWDVIHHPLTKSILFWLVVKLHHQPGSRGKIHHDPWVWEDELPMLDPGWVKLGQGLFPHDLSGRL